MPYGFSPMPCGMIFLKYWKWSSIGSCAHRFCRRPQRAVTLDFRRYVVLSVLGCIFWVIMLSIWESIFQVCKRFTPDVVFFSSIVLVVSRGQTRLHSSFLVEDSSRTLLRIISFCDIDISTVLPSRYQCESFMFFPWLSSIILTCCPNYMQAYVDL